MQPRSLRRFRIMPHVMPCLIHFAVPHFVGTIGITFCAKSLLLALVGLVIW
jgi:hypothetical protein